MKRLVSTVGTAAAAALALVATATVASASTNVGTLYSSCGGTRTAASNIYNSSGALLSTLEVYENGQRYRESVACVRNVHRGGYYGTTLATSVHIGSLYDSGSYQYYAGAIRTSGAWDGSYSIHIGGANPSDPDRDYGCTKVSGTTAGHTKVIWLCYSTNVSR